MKRLRLRAQSFASSAKEVGILGIGEPRRLRIVQWQDGRESCQRDG